MKCKLDCESFCVKMGLVASINKKVRDQSSCVTDDSSLGFESFKKKKTAYNHIT